MNKRTVSKSSRNKKTGTSRKPATIKSNNSKVLPSPWDEFFGMFKDDADFKAVKANIARRRKQLDLDDSRP